MSASNVRLAWVRIADEIRHVSDCVEIPRHLRQQCTCPQCGEPVVLKLGNVLAHHCAHLPGSLCPATESALHINAKYHVWRELLAHPGAALQIQVTCAGSPYDSRCEHTGVLSWVDTWDRVELERAIGQTRPDIVLFFHEQPIAAIEIVATHRVDDCKTQTFSSLGIPWIEVPATAPLDLQWTQTQPLPVVQRGPEAPWRCGSCADIQQEWDDYELGAEYSERNEQQLSETPGVRLWRTRLVDIYYKSGKRYREQVSAYLLCRDQRPIATYVVTHSDGQVFAWVAYPELDQWGCSTLGEFVRTSFESYLESRRERGITVDSPMEWEPALPDYNRNAPPPRYTWRPATLSWCLSQRYRDSRWRSQRAGRGRRPTMRWC